MRVFMPRVLCVSYMMLFLFQLEKLRVGHDNQGSSPEWFLKELAIEIPSRGDRLYFPYNNWVAGEHVDLDPGENREFSQRFLKPLSD